MAHFAKINSEGIVEQIIVVSNKDCGNLEFPASESIGQTFISSLGFDGTWKQTSYSGSFRKNYAGIGGSYIERLDAFVPYKLFHSWTLDETTCEYFPPVLMPEDGTKYRWSEEQQTWIQ